MGKEVTMRLPKLPRINGRRGAFQILLGTVFGMLATSLFITKDYPSSAAWLETFIPNPATLGIVWMVPAIAAYIGAFQPRPRDWFSFFALTLAPMIWGSLSFIGGFIAPTGTTPLAIIMYWCLAGTVMVVSGMTGDRDRDERLAAT